jgi:tRNA(Ile)-lysidine synthase
MSESVSYNSYLRIIRPFLSFKKADLIYVTLNVFKTYIKDPSNEDEKFLRVRIRNYKRNMEKEGLDTRKIIKTINNLLSANEALTFYKKQALYKYVSFLSKDKCLVNKQIFTEEAGEIIFKSFSDILSLVSGAYYPPRSKKIINLINRIKKAKFNKSTLGGCVIEKKNSFILISKEPRIGKMSFQLEK